MQRIIGIVFGAVVTFLLLLLLDSTKLIADRNTSYLAAVIIGGISTWAWPFILSIWLTRRARARRDERIESEVERQVAAQTKRPGD